MQLTRMAGIGMMGLCLACAARAESGEWAVKKAPVRFLIGLTGAPSHASAGYFITIPDGGILPGPAPVTQVFDEEGNALKSGILWYNHATGAGLVFESPAKGKQVTLYVTGAEKAGLWTPESGLTPSAILCARPGAASRDEALHLNDLGLVAAQVQYRNQGKIAGNWGGEAITLAMTDNSFGRSGSSALYMLAYVDVSDPGSTWVAPISRAGQMEVAIDGQLVHTFKLNEKRGGVGSHVALTAGLHRVELYGYNTTRGDVGPMMLTWRTPKTPPGELGGKRSGDLRYSGTPMFESRQVKPGEVVESGRGEIREIQSRDGGPVAWFTVDCVNTFWFGGEDPLLQYTLRAGTKGNPAATRYTWRFGSMSGAEVAGDRATWLFTGNADQWVTLAAEAEGKRSEATAPFLAVANAPSSVNNPATRAAFRQTSLGMLMAYPEKADPVAQWGSAMWNNFFRVLDIQAGDPLLDYIVTNRWEAFTRKLDTDRKALLEDLFLFSRATRDPASALEWAARFSQAAPNPGRAAELQLKRAEILMYYLGDLKAAREGITPLLSVDGEIGEWARIRMGDLEFLSRRLNEATQYFGDVQGRSRHGTGAETSRKPRLKEWSGPVKLTEFARQKAPRKAGSTAKEDPGSPADVADWKLGAIRDVAMSETVATLIDQGLYLEAMRSLREWERVSPLSKITGDFLLREGKLYLALKDFKRARVLLGAYCDQVDTSNFLPEALRMVAACMRGMNEPETEVAKFEKESGKRIKSGSGE